MPITVTITVPIFTSMLLAGGVHGVSSSQLSLGIATGLQLYASSGLTVATIDTGLAGAGIGAGVGIIIPPPVLVGSMISAFASHGIAGIMSPSLATAIGTAMSQILAQANIVTTHPSVGTGAGVAKLIPNPPSSQAAFLEGFLSSGIIGVMGPNLASAVAQGLDAALPSGVGAVIITGSASTAAASGVGTGLIQ